MAAKFLGDRSNTTILLITAMSIVVESLLTTLKTLAVLLATNN